MRCLQNDRRFANYSIVTDSMDLETPRAADHVWCVDRFRQMEGLRAQTSGKLMYYALQPQQLPIAS
jgi:hypothetical protein